MDEAKERMMLLQQLENHQTQMKANERKLEGFSRHREANESSSSREKNLKYKEECENKLKRATERWEDEKKHWREKKNSTCEKLDKEIEEIEEKMEDYCEKQRKLIEQIKEKMEDYCSKQRKVIESLKDKKHDVDDTIRSKLDEKESESKSAIEFHRKELARVSELLESSVKKSKAEINVEIDQEYRLEEIKKLKIKLSMPLTIDSVSSPKPIVKQDKPTYDMNPCSDPNPEEEECFELTIQEMEKRVARQREIAMEEDRKEVERIENEKKAKLEFIKQRELRYKKAVNEIRDREDKLPHDSSEREELYRQRKKLRIEDF